MDDRVQAYVLGALSRATNIVVEALEGRRNVTLFAQAAGVAELLHLGIVSDERWNEAFTVAAVQAGLDQAEIRATLRSAFQRGTTTPREVPKAVMIGQKSLAWRSRAGPCPPTERDEDCKDRISAAQGIWDTAGPLEGPGVGYLMGRGIASAETVPARLLRASDGISIVFPLHDAKGKLVAVQMVKIDDNGQAILRDDGRKDKRSRGLISEGLFYAHHGTDDAQTIVCEGPESALSVSTAYQSQPGLQTPTIVAMMGWRPRAISAVKNPNIMAESGKEVEAYAAATKHGGRVVICAEHGGDDPNDILAKAGPEALVDAIENAQTPEANAKPLKLSEYSVKAWLGLDIPPRDFMLHGLVATTSRIMLFAPTGVGKTLLSLNLAAAVAAGKPFLRWEGAGQQRRVLYLDGEMPAETTKDRVKQVADLWGLNDSDQLVVINRDILASREIEMPPLNTEPGEMWLHQVIAEVKPDLIVFDSIMSLLSGSMRDEESWEPVKLLVKQLTTRRIGQLWLHHTGHDKDRAYGTSTRTWEMDTVIRLAAEDTGGFTINFEKMRLGKPDDHQIYKPLTVSLSDQGWEFKDAPKAKQDARGSDRVRMERLYAQAINDLILNIGQPNHSGHDGKPVRAVGLNEVREHLKRHGHLVLNETGGLEVSARKALNRAKGDLLASGDFAGDDKMIWRIGNS